MTAEPEIKGWCPGAHRPMRSGDGLVVRVRPRGGEIAPDALTGLAALAGAHGSGAVEVTARANLQIRGVSDDGHAPLLAGLQRLGLLDADPAVEARRNITLTPFRSARRDLPAIAEGLALGLADPAFASLPGKFGFVIDAEPGARRLAAISGDIRIEGAGGAMVVRVDGRAAGRAVATSEEAVGAALALARWFIASGGVGTDGRGRMRRHLARGATLPAGLSGAVEPDAAQPLPAAGPMAGGLAVAAAFGQFAAADLERIAKVATAPVRPTPFRGLFLPGLTAPAALAHAPGLILRGDDPLLRVVACTGAPGCPQALGSTRETARQLAPLVPKGALLHVSGCAKGCAHPAAAPLTLVATAAGFDLVRSGAPWDQPARCGLDRARLVDALEG